MHAPEIESRLRTVRSHYRVTPWIRPREDEAPLLRSWQRCLDAGLREQDRVHFELVSRSLLAELDDRHGALVQACRPEVERLGRALQGAGCAVLLFSPRGMVIDRLCHEASAPNALLATTRVGMNVAERCVGTTAPAIALAEDEPYLVGRDAHFCDNVRPFFCVAAPIANPRGERVAALDITAFDNVPAFDLLSLVVDSAVAIENQLFLPSPERLLLRLHTRAECLGTPMEGLLELDLGGRVTGANRAAERLLCHGRGALLQQRFDALFDHDPRRLFNRAPHHGLLELQARHGLQLLARLDCQGGAPRGCIGEAAALCDAPCPGTPAPAVAPTTLREQECRTIAATLAELDGNISATAQRLGISRNTVYRRLAQWRAQGG